MPVTEVESEYHIKIKALKQKGEEIRQAIRPKGWGISGCFDDFAPCDGRITLHGGIGLITTVRYLLGKDEAVVPVITVASLFHRKNGEIVFKIVAADDGELNFARSLAKFLDEKIALTCIIEKRFKEA